MKNVLCQQTVDTSSIKPAITTKVNNINHGVSRNASHFLENEQHNRNVFKIVKQKKNLQQQQQQQQQQPQQQHQQPQHQQQQHRHQQHQPQQQQRQRQYQQRVLYTQNQQGKEGKNITKVTDKQNLGEDASRLASILVVGAFIPACCCLFFLCLNCPVFALHTKLNEVLLRRKQERLEPKTEKERIRDDGLPVLKGDKKTDNELPVLIDNKQEKNIIQTTCLVTNPHVRETICCNFVCICISKEKYGKYFV